MADIEIVYRVGYCDDCIYSKNYNTQCHTCVAEDMSCKGYSNGVHNENVIHFGDCVNARFKYIRKGWTGKRYEMEEMNDDYNPHLNCMEVILGNTLYYCVKVVLNGKCIYNEYDDDEVVNQE